MQEETRLEGLSNRAIRRRESYRIRMPYRGVSGGEAQVLKTGRKQALVRSNFTLLGCTSKVLNPKKQWEYRVSKVLQKEE